MPPQSRAVAQQPQQSTTTSSIFDDFEMPSHQQMSTSKQLNTAKDKEDIQKKQQSSSQTSSIFDDFDCTRR